MTDRDFVFSELADSDIPDLVDLIAETGRETGAHNRDIMNLELWRWQYKDLPTGASYVYLAKHNGRIVGYYQIAAYDFLAGDRKLRIGQIQLVAVLPSFRGQGLFRRLADYAHQELMVHLDLTYTFPNRRSIRTFLKYNDYKTVKALPMFVLPLATAEIIRAQRKLFAFEYLIGWVVDLWGKMFRKRLAENEALSVRRSFDDEVLDTFERFQNAHQLRLLRDRDYMNWRYLATPKGRHFIVGLEREGALCAVAVVKYEKLFSVRALLIVDFAYNDRPEDLLKLLGNIPRLFGAELPDKAALILCSAFAPFTSHLKWAGFISVPQKLIPRQLNLLARWMRSTADIDIHDPNLWLVTLGDWDVF